MNEIELTEEFDNNGYVNVSLSRIDLYIVKISFLLFNNFIKYTKQKGFLCTLMMVFFSICHTITTTILTLLTRKIKIIVLFYQMNGSNIESIFITNKNNLKILSFKKRGTNLFLLRM